MFEQKLRQEDASSCLSSGELIDLYYELSCPPTLIWAQRVCVHVCRIFVFLHLTFARARTLFYFAWVAPDMCPKLPELDGTPKKSHVVWISAELKMLFPYSVYMCVHVNALVGVCLIWVMWGHSHMCSNLWWPEVNIGHPLKTYSTNVE